MAAQSSNQGEMFFDESQYSDLIEAIKRTGHVLAAMPKRKTKPASAPRGIFFTGHPERDNYFRLYSRDPGTQKHEYLGISVAKALYDRNLSETGGMAKDTSDIYRLSEIPFTRTFVYFDISAFSSMSAKAQHRLMVYLTNVVFNLSNSKTYYMYEARLCIGDGFIFVFDDPLAAILFSCELAHFIDSGRPSRQVNQDLNYRIGIHMGKVRCFWDWGMGERGAWNYVGNGINGGQRVVALISKELLDNTIFISSIVYRYCYDIYSSNHISRRIEKENKQKRSHSASIGNSTGPNSYVSFTMFRTAAEIVVPNCINRGTREDKHKKPWRVYQINHAAIQEAKNHPDYVEPDEPLPSDDVLYPST